jgi:hypothetical protein
MADEYAVDAHALIWFLGNNEMHDRLIAATALHLAGNSSSVPLLTRDPDIAFSGLVPVL